MQRADELFNKILSDGEVSIDEFILSRKAEELFLDFKRSSDNGSGTRLSQIDRNNLAKAISGFGNSEGGIIVWGVDCSQDFDGADVARMKIPIVNPTRFASWLNNAISGCTIPPHQNVRNAPITIEDNNGYVITLIPKSNDTPHQMVGKLHYYIRAGSDFIPTPHDVLAGLFGKRPQSHIIHQFLVNPITVINNSISIRVGIMLKNLGPGIASDVFITCMVWGGIGDNCEIGFDETDSTIWYGNFSLGMHLSLISKADLKLPPNGLWIPVTVNVTIAPPIDKKLSIQATVGCKNGRSSNFSFENTPTKIQELYEECLQKYANNELEGLEYDYASKILNCEFEKPEN